MNPVPLLDLLGCFAVAGELGRGQPAGHVSRTAVLAVAVADHLGLDETARSDAFQASLLVHAGCTAGLSEVAAVLLCDEMALQRDACLCDPANEMEILRVLLKHAGRGAGASARLRSITRLPTRGAEALKGMEAGCSEVGARIAARLGMSAGTVDALSHICETWNGKGPNRRRGPAIPLLARIINAAMTAEIFLATSGPDAAIAAVRRRAGRSLDPVVVQAIASLLLEPAVIARIAAASDWGSVATLAAAPETVIDADELDGLTLACADLADLKVPGSAAHSRRVGQLAEAVMLRAGHRAESQLARYAGHVHAIGQVALPAELLTGRPLSLAETEQLMLHPVFTRRVLSHSSTLAAIGRIAAMHHERADGAGYPEGRSGFDFPLAARAVAAACAWDESWTGEAATAVGPALATFREASEGAYGMEITVALCDEVAGVLRPRRPAAPEGLTEREIEVLTLAATGKTIQEIASMLVISKHTARHHLESIYGKVGVTSRAAATLYAVESGLLG